MSRQQIEQRKKNSLQKRSILLRTGVHFVPNKVMFRIENTENQKVRTLYFNQDFSQMPVMRASFTALCSPKESTVSQRAEEEPQPPPLLIGSFRKFLDPARWARVVEYYGGKVVTEPPDGTVYLGSHLTSTTHDISFTTHGIQTKEGENYGKQAQYGEGFYVSPKPQEAKWAGEAIKTSGGEPREWMVFSFKRLSELKLLNGDEIDLQDQYGRLPWTSQKGKGSYINDYDGIFDEGQIKFNPSFYKQLFLVKRQ